MTADNSLGRTSGCFEKQKALHCKGGGEGGEGQGRESLWEGREWEGECVRVEGGAERGRSEWVRVGRWEEKDGGEVQDT